MILKIVLDFNQRGNIPVYICNTDSVYYTDRWF